MRSGHLQANDEEAAAEVAFADLPEDCSGGPAMELASRFSEMSAAGLQTTAFVRWTAALACGVVLTLLIAPLAALPVLSVLIGLPFLFIALLRCAGIVELVRPSDRTIPAEEPCDGVGKWHVDEHLPHYAVLVPLYKEADVVPQLLEALAALEYPKERLEISLIVEEDDAETRAAIKAHILTSNMRLVIVPEGLPRTKPRALNYALADAVGDYVVVFDAEDVPDPDQLRRALRLLQRNPAVIGCVQARLDIYNTGRSFFTRQFTIEYSALFGAILPVLERMGLPVPLGGTSNHFPGILAQTHLMYHRVG